MNTFKGRLVELENVMIDNFSHRENETCFFLSHCHADHMRGLRQLLLELKKNRNNYLYCSPLSRLILLNMYDGNFKEEIKEITSTTTLKIPESHKCPSYLINVTPIPAGHCPGSIMFLFETTNKTILYTGDFRILKNDAKSIIALQPYNKLKDIDKIYFDCTFLNKRYWNFPSRIEAVEKIIIIINKWIKKGVNYNVLLETAANYGYEYVLTEVAKKLGYKIHVKNSFYKLYQNVPEVGSLLTTDCSTTKIHSFFTRDTKCAPYYNKKYLLKIKLSAQWYKSSIGNIKPICKQVSRQKMIICFSNHCSCSELIDFLNYLHPLEAEPCTSVVGSTETEKNSFIIELMKPWKSNRTTKNIENIHNDLNLDRSYKFKIKFPQFKSRIADGINESVKQSGQSPTSFDDDFFKE